MIVAHQKMSAANVTATSTNPIPQPQPQRSHEPLLPLLSGWLRRILSRPKKLCPCCHCKAWRETDELLSQLPAILDEQRRATIAAIREMKARGRL